MAFPLPHAPEALALLEKGGVPAFRTLEACAETVVLLADPPRPVPPAGARLPAATAALLAEAPPGTLDEVRGGMSLEDRFFDLYAERMGQDT